MIRLTRILYPTDFSEDAAHALPYALNLARQFGAVLHVAHVVEHITAPAYYEAYIAPDLAAQTQLHDQATAQLQAIAEQAQAHQVSVERHILRGTPFAEMCRLAREQEIDLIVMATHGRSGLVHMLLGSTAEKVVRKAPCPVLTIKHPEREFVLDDVNQARRPS